MTKFTTVFMSSEDSVLWRHVHNVFYQDNSFYLVPFILKLGNLLKILVIILLPNNICGGVFDLIMMMFNNWHSVTTYFVDYICVEVHVLSLSQCLSCSNSHNYMTPGFLPFCCSSGWFGVVHISDSCVKHWAHPLVRMITGQAHILNGVTKMLQSVITIFWGFNKIDQFIWQIYQIFNIVGKYYLKVYNS